MTSETIATVRMWCRNGTARRLRLAAGLTLVDLGRDVGVSHVTIRAWERGERVPTSANALRYAEVLQAATRAVMGAGDVGAA